MSVQGSVSFACDLLDSRLSDNEESSIKIARSFSAAFLDGAGLNQINSIWQDTAILPDTTPVQLDVSPTASSGTAGIVTFARVKAVLVWAAVANTTNISVVRHATTGVAVFTVAAAGVVLKPGGMFLWVDPSATGVAVTGGASDLFTLTNSAATPATYSIVIAGSLT